MPGGGQFPSIDPNGPMAQLIAAIQALRSQDQQSLSSQQDGLLQQLMQVLCPPSGVQGFSEGQQLSMPGDPTQGLPVGQ